MGYPLYEALRRLNVEITGGPDSDTPDMNALLLSFWHGCFDHVASLESVNLLFPHRMPARESSLYLGFFDFA